MYKKGLKFRIRGQQDTGEIIGENKYKSSIIYRIRYTDKSGFFRTYDVHEETLKHNLDTGFYIEL